MPELDVTPATYRVRANAAARVGVAASTGAQVILVPVPGGQGPPGEGVQVFGETPTGLIDGVNTAFTVSQPYLAASTAVYLNGLRETQYTETTTTVITFDDPPISGDNIRIDYILGS